MADTEISNTATTETKIVPEIKAASKVTSKSKKDSRPKKTIQKPKKTTDATDQKKPRTTGMALLQSLTAKKAAQEALVKSAKPKVHVSFDDDGEMVTTVEEEKPTNDKKRKEQPLENDDQSEPIVIKKEKKRKGTHHLQGPSDKKKQESLTYLQVFVEDRSQWKFGKKQQSWLLQHIYDTEAISTEDFDRLLVYLEDLMGMAREKTLKDAQTICQETKGTVSSAPLQVESTFNDDDDFDAEKLLAASAPPPPPSDVTTDKDDTVTTDDNAKLDRAKAIVRILM